MENKSQPHLALLNIDLYKLNQKDVAELKKPRHQGIPKYCLNKNGNIIDSDYYNQYVTDESYNAAKNLKYE
jgi:hypothetical protein